MASDYILCLLGNTTHRFDRLVNLAIDLKSVNCRDLVVQSGPNKYSDEIEFQFGFCDKSELQDLIFNASLVVTHCGSGMLGRIIRNKKPNIIIPRLARFLEHVDDHQCELAYHYSKLKQCFLPSNYSDQILNINEIQDELHNYQFDFSQRDEPDLAVHIASLVNSICQ